VGGLFLYLSVIFTWRLTLWPDKIVLRHTFHERAFAVADLLGVRLLTVTSNRSPEPLLVLELLLSNGRSIRINQNELSVPLPQLVDLMVHHYQLPLTYEREAARVHPTQFGAGSRRPFADYLNGESRVTVQSVADICRWLQQCEYVRDADLFNQKDVWQHPGEFEARQKGDCEDHALWAWRKLKELNISAEFVVGRLEWGDEAIGAGAHAWVTYVENGRRLHPGKHLQTTAAHLPAGRAARALHPLVQRGWRHADLSLSTRRCPPSLGTAQANPEQPPAFRLAQLLRN
jgi:hypothetical protein